VRLGRAGVLTGSRGARVGAPRPHPTLERSGGPAHRWIDRWSRHGQATRRTPAASRT